MKCAYCLPHADPRKQRLCHVGAELFRAYKDAGEHYIELAQMADPPVVAMEKARESMTEARRAYRAHTDGE